MLYEYLITAYKVLVGLITTKRLVIAAISAFAFYLLWICVALIFSFQNKFNLRCQKIISGINKNQLSSSNIQGIDERIEKLSSGFSFGWKKFKNAGRGKPSDHITRREALDVEISGGIFNQGKSIMRAFIGFVAVVLFVFNFAYLGNESSITAYLIAESAVLPLVFYAISKLFYFLYTSIKQQMYKQDIESFYELVSKLDDMFGTTEQVSTNVLPNNVAIETEVQTIPNFDEQEEKQAGANEVEAELKDLEKNIEEETGVEAEKPEENELDKYDIFKKRNIDVDKLMSETPNNSNSLPYINVDSDYVIKDDDEVGYKAVSEQDTASSILGGMMQNTSMAKKGSNFIDVDKPIAEIDQEKVSEINAKKEPENETLGALDDLKNDKPAGGDDAFSSFEKFEVAENRPAESEIEKETPKTEDEEKSVEKTENVVNNDVEQKSTSVEIKGNESVEKPAEKQESVSEDEKVNLANVVSGFKSSRSKLASGGIVIEKNEPIVRRERQESVVSEPQSVEDNYFETPVQPHNVSPISQVNRPVADNNTDDILNSIRSTAGGYDPNFQAGYEQPYQVPNYNAGYGYNAQQNYVPQTPIMPQQSGYGYMNSQMPNYNVDYGNTYNRAGMNNYMPTQDQQYNDYAEDDYEEIEEVSNVQTPKAKVVRTKENEPRPRNLRQKTVAEIKENDDMAKRGRPKKQEVSETMVIKNDKEFEQILARAEKLMRKSDEGLSASQSKRIEKELKVLIDAMNRYKESK